MTSPAVRAETAADHDAVRRVETAAFGRPDEADLVDALRADGDAAISLVAERNGAVVGHILFSPLPVVGDQGALNAAALAPVAVDPACQNQGIGGVLIRAGLAACAEAGFEAVVVLGHPDYYPRFGFSAKAALGLSGPFSGPSFMALDLRARDGAALAGAIRYPRAFGLD